MLALLVTPQSHRLRADVERHRNDRQNVVQNPRDLREQDPDPLPALRHLDAQQLLGGQRKRVLHTHRRDVVEPIEIRQRLRVRLVLDQLLGAAVQQPDMRIDAVCTTLAIHLQHQAQYAVSRRMLRTEIDPCRVWILVDPPAGQFFRPTASLRVTTPVIAPHPLRRQQFLICIICARLTSTCEGPLMHFLVARQHHVGHRFPWRFMKSKHPEILRQRHRFVNDSASVPGRSAVPR